MKKQLARLVRKALPSGAVKKIEKFYRNERLAVTSLAYGNPAKNLKVIGITGTNGKTTTTNYINEILKEAGLKTAMFSTAAIEVDGKREINDLNVTVATTAQMQKFFSRAKRAKVDYVLLEVTSHALDQHKLANVPIYMAVMTNLTQDHLDYHKTMDNYAKAKGALFAGEPKYIVLNRDDEWFSYFDQFIAGELKVSYGRDKDSSVRIKSSKLYRKGTEANLLMGEEDLEVATSIPGEYNSYNMAAAAAAASLLDVDPPQIQDGIANLESLSGRFERVSDGLDYDIIVDYAHTPDAIEKLLKSAKEIAKGRTVLVFGSMGERDKEKRPIMGEIAAKNADLIFLTDEENDKEPNEDIRAEIFSGIKLGGGEAKTTEIADRKEAIKEAIKQAKKGDMILVTGLGHETYRLVNGERIKWSDQDVIRKILDEIK